MFLVRKPLRTDHSSISGRAFFCNLSIAFSVVRKEQKLK